MKEIILKYVLKNALDFNGSVNDKVVLGSVLREDASLKKQVPLVLKEITQVINEVKELSLEEQQEKLLSVAPELLKEEKQEEKGPLKPLVKAQKGSVVVRIAPSPSGGLHIGHVYGASINDAYAKMYQGRLILRLEDTNPTNIYAPAYEMIPDDVTWLTDKGVSEVVVQSSRLGHYYDHAEKLVTSGDAYVCTCDADDFRTLKAKKEACPCRKIPAQEQTVRYAQMFSSYAPGAAVLRMKTDIAHKNPAMRDFALMRIVEHVHPKTCNEHRVWPLMVFSVAIDDHLLGVTHVINGKDQADNAQKEKLIMAALGWDAPEYKHWGFINFKGMSLSSSKTKLAIEEGEYTGWDDIRLPFLPALRRRGYQAEALRAFALEVGLTLNDKTVAKEEFWKLVNAKNKELVEPLANRYFFVANSVKVTVEGAPHKDVKIALHPDFADRGVRELKLSTDVWLAQEDLEKIEEGRVCRLIDGYNFIKRDGKLLYHSELYDAYKGADKKGPIIQWVGAEHVAVALRMEDNSIVEGIAEKSVMDVPVGSLVQFARIAFFRKDSEKEFWYLHG